MKYAYAMVILICLLSSTSWSANPMIKNCNNYGGEFTVVQTSDDQWALCKFGKAYVGALDVMYFNNQTAEPTSFVEYAEQHKQCDGQIVEATILGTSKKLELCQYEDQSFIDTTTLSKGPHHSDNAALNKYLGL